MIQMRWGVLTLSVFALTALPSFAGLISVTGVDFLSAPPADVTALSSDTAAFVWQEQSLFTLPQDVTVSFKGAGSFGCKAIPCTVPSDSGTLAAGTVVNSYYVHYEPQTTPVNTFDFLQSILIFDKSESVLGIIAGAHNLRTTDPIFKPAGSTYPINNTIGGLEIGLDYDQVQLTTDGVNLRDKAGFYFSANTKPTGDPFDDVRILTAPTPEPAGLLLLGSGLAVLGFRRKRRPVKRADH